jgi:FlaA1/EpsC-like NDP-sugar epimerase
MSTHRISKFGARIGYLAAILFSCLAAFELRFDFAIPQRAFVILTMMLVAAAAAKAPIFYLAGLHRSLWMFAELGDLRRLLMINVLASAVFTAIVALLTSLYFQGGFSRSICVIDFLVCCLSTLVLRYAGRFYLDSAGRRAPGQKRKNILIYGAGAAGATLLREIRGNKSLGYHVIGFLDDDESKRGAVLMGVRVLGCGRQAASIVAHLNRHRARVEEIVIAMPSATGRERREAVANCQAAHIPCKTIPGLGDLLNRKVLAEQIRDVALTDLLGRPAVQLDEAPVREGLAGQCVLVTGAAGSIGSELCRQIARFNPSRLIAFDQAESDLFRIECELRDKYPELDFVPALGDIRDVQRLDQVFSQGPIDSVFHAAAYKHVPMMETHVLEAVHNNIFGTLNLIQAVEKHHVPNFLMISSDKAVNPTNVMGATKRVCEMIVSASASSREGRNTKCVSVRFGNVLGSNGSVVPIFQQQIQGGGPVKVTHPDVQRYFMTASEAVSLVLCAHTMGKGSEIFVLDMGEPVRVLDLAINMIRLAGLVPYQDIDIRFTGLRPGEKLFEETNLPAEKILPTEHKKIKIFRQTPPDWSSIVSWLAELRRLIEQRAELAIVEHIQDLVPEYRPSQRWKRPKTAVARPVAAPEPAKPASIPALS